MANMNSVVRARARTARAGVQRHVQPGQTSTASPPRWASSRKRSSRTPTRSTRASTCSRARRPRPPPYKAGAEDEYLGNAGTVSRSIGPGASVTINTDISSLLGNGAAAKDGKLLDTLRTISEHLLGGTVEDREALNSTDLKAIDANLETLTQLQATAGSVTNQLQVASSRIEDLETSLAKTLSNVQDVDVAKASIAFSNQQAAYEAALRAGASIVQESLMNFLH